MKERMSSRSQNMATSKRIEQGGRWILLIEYLFYWAGTTAITVATAYYLWGGWENDSVHGYCHASNEAITSTDGVCV